MPAAEGVVFDAFHHHCWRSKWDSLVRATHILGDAPCPFVGAVSQNAGGGMLRGLSMQTQFISYDRPRVAAAKMIGTSFPFRRWSASMRHRPTDDGQSVLIYTYSFEVSPSLLKWLMTPVVDLIFYWQTRRRFGRLAKFLGAHGAQVVEWQSREHATRTAL